MVAEKVETKQEAFERIAVLRVGNAMTALRRIRTITTRSRYDYTKGHVAEIAKALRDEVNELNALFEAGLAGKETYKSTDAFTFSKKG